MRLHQIVVKTFAVACLLSSCGGEGESQDVDGGIPDSSGELSPSDVRSDTADVASDVLVEELQGDVPVLDSVELVDAQQPVDEPGPVLLLDLEMRHPVSFSFLMERFADRGHQLTYRRWYPHLTQSDIIPDPATGELPYRLVIVSAGNAPSEPSPRLRREDADNLVQYIEQGGNVLFLVRHTWLDGHGGDCDWFYVNRVLAATGVQIRAQRNTAIGYASQPLDGKPPRHIEVAAAYPGGLEWTLNYPVGYPALDHPAMDGQEPFAAGVTSTLACDGPEVAVLTWTHQNILLWQTLDSGPNSLSIPLVEQPLAAVAPAVGPGAGMVAVVPRSLVQLPVHTEYMSDKPILNFGQLDAAEAVAAAVLDHISALTVDSSHHAPQGCFSGADDGLLSPAADGFSTLGEGPPVHALYPPSVRALSAAPPTPPEGGPQLTAEVPKGPPQEQTVVPDWYPHGRGRFGWGGRRPYKEMRGFFEHSNEHGITAFVIGVDPQWLMDFYDTGVASDELEELAKAAADAGARVFLGVNWLTPLFGQLREEIGSAVGAYGQELVAPPPVADAYWEKAIRPLSLGAALLSAAYPAIAGMNIDLELYGAGSLWYAQGFAFDDDTWSKAVEIISGHSAALAEQGAALSVIERLPWLVDEGLVGLVYGGLDDETALRVAQLRDEAADLAPEFELSIYGVMVSTAWFYRGWLRGAGTPSRPVTHLTYDVATNRARDILANEGLHVRILGGVLGVLFGAEDLGKALVNAGTRSDGYWLFQFTDFPYEWDVESPPALHSTPDEYWAAIEAANIALDQL